MTSPNIFDWIKSEESRFETEEIQLGDNWFWSFRKYVQMIFHLKHGIFFTGANDWTRAFKNIYEPILNLAYWTEDIEVKDVVFFIESSMGKVLSFLVKKYHDEVYVKEHNLDELFDDITESDLDFGGALVQDSMDAPEVLPLLSIAFCDQNDILSGPIAFKHYFSPDKLRGMSRLGWGEERNGANIALDDLCVIASGPNDDQKNKSSGKVIEVYIVRGNLPEHYLLDNDNIDEYYNQIQIVAFYVDKEGKKQGVILYRKKEKEGNLKFHTSQKVYRRALGHGEGETILGPQIWTNFFTIHKTNLLEAASKVPLVSDDPNFANRQKIQDMETLEITTIEEGKSIKQIPTAAVANIQLYSGEINEWWQFAQTSGAANDPIMGKEAASGTTFKGQERTVAQGRGLHDRRRGKRAKFIEELYRDFIIPKIKKEILKGQKFMADLTSDELNWVAEQIAINKANAITKKKMFTGTKTTPEQQRRLIQEIKNSILKKGKKQLIEILRDEFEDVKIKMGINIAGKQKNLFDLSDKLLSIFQFAFADPDKFRRGLQIPALAKSFENILEFGGLSIADFSSLLEAPEPAQIATPVPSPIKEMPMMSVNKTA